MCKLDTIRLNSREIYALAAKFNADKVYVFGSCARKEETPDSDIDFLVDFNADASLNDHVHLQSALQQLFSCKIDVVSKRGLNPLIKDEILLEAVAI